MRVLVKITKHVLKDSMFCSEYKIGQNCAIAKAIVDLFGENTWVGSKKIFIFPNGIKFLGSLEVDLSQTSYIIDLPEKASDFIREFDNKSPYSRLQMDELSFEIDVPDEVIQSIGIDEVHNILKESKSLELV